MKRALDGGQAIEKAIRAANEASRPALSAFLTAGFPSRDDFGELLQRVAQEAELVEIGVPFSDPMADGVTIQRSSREALAAGVTLSWILEVVARTECASPLVLMSYLNPLLAMGLGPLCERAAAAGIDGLIVPDLPYEECGPLADAARSEGLALIQLVTPVTAPPRLAELSRASSGFVYAVTVTGTTGGRDVAAGDIGAYLDRVRAVSPVPVLAGFGIRSSEQLAAVAAHADGAIVGSALIEVLERNEDPVSFLRALRDGGPAGQGAP